MNESRVSISRRPLNAREKLRIGYLDNMSGIVNLSSAQNLELYSLLGRHLMQRHLKGEQLGILPVYHREELTPDGGGSNIVARLMVDFDDPVQVEGFDLAVSYMHAAAKLLLYPRAELHFDRLESEMARFVQHGLHADKQKGCGNE